MYIQQKADSSRALNGELVCTGKHTEVQYSVSKRWATYTIGELGIVAVAKQRHNTKSALVGDI